MKYEAVLIRTYVVQRFGLCFEVVRCYDDIT